MPRHSSPRTTSVESATTHTAYVRHKATFAALAVGALGVVFGDIGTSPLYTLKDCMTAAGGAKAGVEDLFGILSLMFWSLIMVVTVKYLTLVMRAENQGEGGIFALLAIAGASPSTLRRWERTFVCSPATRVSSPTSPKLKRSKAITVMSNPSTVHFQACHQRSSCPATPNLADARGCIATHSSLRNERAYIT